MGGPDEIDFTVTPARLVAALRDGTLPGLVRTLIEEGYPDLRYWQTFPLVLRDAEGYLNFALDDWVKRARWDSKLGSQEVTVPNVYRREAKVVEVAGGKKITWD